jgi:flagellar biosynthesis/type III secretory pathway M-ring protein FliF/YscJ
MMSTCLLFVCPTIAQTDQAASKLQAANTAVNQAFNEVLDAEAAGANVTVLLAQMNTAQGILAQTENSYRTGDANAASTLAVSVLPIAQQAAVDAQSAKQDAIVSSRNAFWFTIAIIAIAVFVFVLVLFLVWRKFKRDYIGNLYEAKPEVVNDVD